jgi:hypothetical protein
MLSILRIFAFALSLAAGRATPVDAQVVARLVDSNSTAGIARPMPVRGALMTGERWEYQARYGPFSVGSASLQVMGIDTVRGRPAWHTRVVVEGRFTFFKLHDVLESWLDSATFTSVRYHQTQNEGNKQRVKRYEIFPERAVYVDSAREGEQPSVDEPLDDGGILFYVRTLPLEQGAVYEVNRYFKPDRNPVRIEVVKRERIRVPAGTFETIVVRPVIKAKGVFGDGGEAQVWVTDDERRMIVQIRTKMKVGSVTLQLRNARAGDLLPGTESDSARP